MSTDHRPEIETVLAAWRAVQSNARDLSDGSSEALRLREEVDRLRREYQALVAMAAADFRAAQADHPRIVRAIQGT